MEACSCSHTLDRLEGSADSMGASLRQKQLSFRSLAHFEPPLSSIRCLLFFLRFLLTMPEKPEKRAALLALRRLHQAELRPLAIAKLGAGATHKEVEAEVMKRCRELFAEQAQAQVEYFFAGPVNITTVNRELNNRVFNRRLKAATKVWLEQDASLRVSVAK